jgi:hypothetical protein
MTVQVSQEEKPLKLLMEVVPSTEVWNPGPFKGIDGYPLRGSHDVPEYPGEDTEKRNLCRISFSL